MSRNAIIIRGARQHNLKGVDVDIPRDKLVVITGLSGSGKSSLAFDTIYAEGQRRYIESLSAYARQFLGQMDKPDVDYIEGLSPAISIEQRTASRNPRSTVATTTEIHDYLRLLYARIGQAHCPTCGQKIDRMTVEQIVEKILDPFEGSTVQILSPVLRGKKGEHADLLEDLWKQGYTKVRIDGKIQEAHDAIKLQKTYKHTIEAVVDSVTVSKRVRARIADSVQTALGLSRGLVQIEGKGKIQLFSEDRSCPRCGVSLEEMTPRMFSFNSPYGACKECSGLGSLMRIDPDRVIPDKKRTLREGAIEPFAKEGSGYMDSFETIAKHYGYGIDTPWEKYPKRFQEILLYGSKGEKIRFRYEGRSGSWSYEGERATRGVVRIMERRHKETHSEAMRTWYESYMSITTCPACRGDRLRPESLAVLIGGKTIAQIARFSIDQAHRFFQKLKLSERERLIARQILKEIVSRLEFLLNVGLEYITLDRTTSTLSGGEAQRIQLATQIGSSLVGVLYILDEPSVGLHQRDNRRLIETLKRLRDLGNTVIVVEHDEGMIRSADYLIDLGPGAGRHGGEIVARGSLGDLMDSPRSLTGKYLSGEVRQEVPPVRTPGNGKALLVRGAQENNLKGINVRIPLGTLTCITGVSGSGKSTLVDEILYKALARQFYGAKEKPGKHEGIAGIEHIDKVIIIDQSPIGRTPRSNPATYIGVFTDVRDLFSQVPEAKVRGYRPGRFSFNVKGGRCEACEGDGIVRLEMHFLPDVYVQCEVCKGKRYNQETLEVRYKGRSISEVLSMTVEEALQFFQNIPRIRHRLQTIQDVGLGYIHLGQPATTLSGGEAQRVKLATELSRRATGKTLYILDEPTTGLHFDDVRKLLEVLLRLRETGNTVLIIEHNLDVIKTADHLIDLGPEGGEEGGRIVAQGTPEAVAEVETSHTGTFLRRVLGRSHAKPQLAALTG